MFEYKAILLLILLFCVLVLKAEEPFIIDFDWQSVENYNEFQQDFFYLCKLLEESHPAFIEEIGKESYIQQKNHIAGSLELVVDKQKFAMTLQRFVSQLHDGHTQIYFEQYFGNLFLPVAFAWQGEELVISNVNWGENLGLIGKKVSGIGSMSSKEIEKDLGSYVSAENKYWQRVKLSQLLNDVGFLISTGVVDNENEIEIGIFKDGKAEAFLFKPVVEVRWLKPREHPITAYNGNYFSYEILKEDDVCYFQFNQFQDMQTARIYHNAGLVADGDYEDFQRDTESRGGDFRIFLERMFTDIESSEVKNIVVDLRNNGGGNSILANQFYYHLKFDSPLKTFTTSVKLSSLMEHFYPDLVNYYLNLLSNDFGINASLPYLFDLELETKEDYFDYVKDSDSDFYLPKPGYRFEGNLYFLTSNRTFSSAGDMITIAYDNGIGKIIGEPMGQKPTSYGDILFFTLPKSGLEGGVSHKIFKRPSRNRDDEKTIMPHYSVDVELYEKYVNGIDKVWQKTLEIIKDSEE